METVGLEGKHTVWTHCHIQNGSTVDMTERMERQIERFAPGFRDCILAKYAMSSADLEGYNPNYAGGDVNGGAFPYLRGDLFDAVLRLFEMEQRRGNPAPLPSGESRYESGSQRVVLPTLRHPSSA